jgi:hypothetical protein
MVSFTPQPLYPQGKSPWYPLDRRLDGPQSHSGRGGLEKNSQPRWESNPRTPIVQTEISRLSLFSGIGILMLEEQTGTMHLSTMFTYELINELI